MRRQQRPVWQAQRNDPKDQRAERAGLQAEAARVAAEAEAGEQGQQQRSKDENPGPAELGHDPTPRNQEVGPELVAALEVEPEPILDEAAEPVEPAWRAHEAAVVAVEPDEAVAVVAVVAVVELRGQTNKRRQKSSSSLATT